MIEIALSATLTNLKDKISMTPAICGGYTIQAKHQRLFHLGRELKSPKRSLEALLGFGRNGIYLVHLHSTQPRPLELSSDEEEDVIKSTASSSLKRKKGTQEEIVLETNSSHGVGGTTGGERVVVDLLESDGENDGDIDEVLILNETTGSSTKSAREGDDECRI